ncbi:DUF4238 domain-containing protein [Methylobacter sp.]|uniref:DUF4238 domain-containing protein n=1 Tax=Methylobacter sp. TaxID=2051955 RepID=UPI002FDED9E7
MTKDDYTTTGIFSLNMNLNPKKKQHYVPRGYLKNWMAKREAKEGKKSEGVWVWSINGTRKNRFCTDLMDISQERYFNKLCIDQDIYDMLVYKYQGANELVIGIINELKLLLAVDLYKKELGQNHAKLDVVNKNLLEDKYEKLETAFLKTINKINECPKDYIKDLINGNFDLRDLVGFYAVQLFRSKKMRKSIGTSIKSFTISRDGTEKRLSEEQKDNLIKAILFIESIRFANDLSNTSFSVELLLSNSQDSFITSNSPAVSLGNRKKHLSNVSEIHGFIPLSPKVGMVIRGYKPLNKNFMIRYIDSQMIREYNKITVNWADDEIYTSQSKWCL